MDLELYESALRFEEGFSPDLYECESGRKTIGYGFNIDPNGGIRMPRKVADYWLRLEMEKREEDLVSVFGVSRWVMMLPARRAALMSMHYQLGAGGFRRYKKMISCVMRSDWRGAWEQCLDSKAARNPKLRSRFRRTARVLLTGEIPKEWLDEDRNQAVVGDGPFGGRGPGY